MLGPEFEVDLKKIDPSRLVGTNQDDLEDFFLTLAVIYNDLKGFLHLHKDYFDNHKKPDDFEISGYAGEYNGMTTQFYKTLAGFINEFLIFLKEHEHVYQLPKFKVMLFRLPDSTKAEWAEILEAAFERKDKDKQSLGHKLMSIRNNVAFHYHQSDKVLRSAYKDFFDGSQPGTDFAYYSQGNTMENTRFYYADAAVQRYLMNTAKDEKVSFKEPMVAYGQLQSESFDLLGTINMVLAKLLRQFIELKHNERSV